MKKKSLITSILLVVLCFSLICGATYALFTSESKINITAQSATVKVTATVKDGSITTKSFDKLIDENVSLGNFENGGTAEFTDDYTLALSLLTPGDEVSFVVDVENLSNVAIKYRLEMYSTGDLAPALTAKAKIGNVELDVNGISAWLSATANEVIEDVTITVYFPNAADNNDYQNTTADIKFALIAVQGNGTDAYVESNFVSALVAGGEITLYEDITLTESVTIPTGVSTIINLNGHTLTLNNGVTIDGAYSTIN